MERVELIPVVSTIEKSIGLRDWFAVQFWYWQGWKAYSGHDKYDDAVNAYWQCKDAEPGRKAYRIVHYVGVATYSEPSAFRCNTAFKARGSK